MQGGQPTGVCDVNLCSSAQHSAMFLEGRSEPDGPKQDARYILLIQRLGVGMSVQVGRTEQFKVALYPAFGKIRPLERHMPG